MMISLKLGKLGQAQSKIFVRLVGSARKSSGSRIGSGRSGNRTI